VTSHFFFLNGKKLVSTNIENIFSNNIDMNCICVKTWNQSDSDTMWINIVCQNLRKIEEKKTVFV
jgi:hypothetical protein